MAAELIIEPNQLVRLNTAQQWLDVYTMCAKEMSRLPSCKGDKIATEMADVVERLVAMRANQFRNNSTRTTSVNAASRAGVLPFGKTVATSIATTVYSKEVLEGFGLGDSGEATKLYLKANSKGGNPTTPVEALKMINKKLGKKYRKQVLKDAWFDNRDDITDELEDAMSTEVGEEVADHIVEELVHFIPIAGQLYSAGRGAYKCANKLEKSLTYLTKAALDFHMTVLLPIALKGY